MQTLHLLVILGWIAYQTTAQPRWKLEFESGTYSGDGEPPEVWIKAFDPMEEGAITGKKVTESNVKKSRVWKYKEETLLLYLEHYQHQNHLINYFTCKYP